jgi:L-alanine-DL-glutamate epimerase-like enolase superfamily enzyme
MKRRSFLKNSASAAILTGVAGCSQVSPQGGNSNSPVPPGTGPYYHQGRTEGYQEFRIIPEGRKITKIETFSKESVAVVRVTTDDGQQGWGQISTYNSDITSMILHRNLAQKVLGKDPAHIDHIADQCIEENLKYPWSYVNRALGGIDTAIWDLYGQITGKPVCELLGGTVKPVRIYGSSMSRTIKPDEELERMIRLRDEMGITAFKFRIGKEASRNGDAWENRTEDMVRTLGPALADSCTLLADGNSGYTPDRAIHYGRMLQDYGIGQFEEPCPYWETEWIKEVTDTLDLDVSGGEQDNDIAKWRRMIQSHTFDIIQPDPLYLGGITRTWRTALMANQAGTPTIPHSANHAMVTLFTLHLMRAIPNPGKYLEFSIEFEEGINREARAMYAPALKIEDGALHLPAEPGWGVSIHPEWLETTNYQVSELG